MKKFLAAIGFFTRIPVWKICDIPVEYYKRVVDLWPVAGWITGGITALALWGALQILPPLTAVMLAYSVRLVLTGGLHEDGLADFIDGFGGGTDRKRILEIMKDSRIGSYGVIGLTAYFILLVTVVASIPASLAPWIVLAADTWSKFCGSSLINALPYARTGEEAKNKLVYDRMTAGAFIICLLAGIIPVFFLPIIYWMSILLPIIIAVLIIAYLRYKLGGYTGDCCGATALLCELGFLLTAGMITRYVIQHKSLLQFYHIF